MPSYLKGLLRVGCAIALALAAAPAWSQEAASPEVTQAAPTPRIHVAANTVTEDLLFIATGDVTRPPIGWVDFCADLPKECAVEASVPKDVVLSNRAWRDLVRVNRWVNDTIKPMTDLEHYGVIEKWAYPDDGYGDCEDYVLLKRRMLIDAGWPREALLITVVRETNGDGHAVLTVKTDRGEFILDNQNEAIVLWSETNYRFVKRQSQSDPNVWISLGDTRPVPPTASSR